MTAFRCLPRLGLLLPLAALAACAQFPVTSDRNGADTGSATQADSALALPDDTPEIHGLAAWAAWIGSADPARIQAVIAELRARDTLSPVERARLGLLLTRPGHPGFAPQAGLNALSTALADRGDLTRHDIQTIAANMDETQAWLAQTTRLQAQASAAEARAQDLEAKIRALAEIENGQ